MRNVFLLTVLCLSICFASLGQGEIARDKIQGVGLTLKTDQGSVFVQGIVAKTPADLSGLIHIGDEVSAVKSLPSQDWQETTGQSLEHVVNWIRGPVGTTVGLMLAHADGSKFEVELQRVEFDVQEN